MVLVAGDIKTLDACNVVLCLDIDINCGQLSYSRAGIISSWYAALSGTQKGGAEKTLMYALRWEANDTTTLQVITQEIRL